MYKSIKRKNGLILPAVFLLGFVCVWTPAVGSANSLDNWSIRASETSAYGVGYGNGLYVAVGNVLSDNPAVILTSEDGAKWNPVTYTVAPPFFSLYAVSYVGNVYIGVGQYGRILTSADGEEWTNPDTSGTSSTTLRAVAYGGGKYVAVGNSGGIVYSPDGVNWAAAPTSPTAKTLYSVAYDDKNRVFVAVGASGIILTSSDGAGWTLLESNTTSDLLGITYGKGIFVAVGYSGGILTSADGGATWTMRTIGTSVDLYGITCGDGIFAAAGWNVDSKSSIVLTSYNGATWIPRYPVLQPQDALVSVTYGAHAFLALGSGGAIIQSDPFLPGDINDDGEVDLEDVILCLRVLMGDNLPEVRSDYVRSQIDPDGDGKVGLPDALYVLQRIAALR